VTHKIDLLRSLEQEMGILARRMRRVATERARAVSPDLQVAGFFVLTHLSSQGPARSAEVVDVLGIDKGAVSRQVQHLVELGLVARTPDPQDRRATILSLTEYGEQRLAAVAIQRRASIDERLSDWNDDELTTFVDALARYNRSLS